MKIQVAIILYLLISCISKKIAPIPPFKSQIPAFKSYVTNKGLEYSKNLAIGVLTNDLLRVELPPHRGEIPVIRYEFFLQQMKITQFTVGRSVAHFVAGRGIKFTLSDVTMDMSFNWNYRGMIWPHISDGGTGMSALKDIEISGEIEMYQEGGKINAVIRNLIFKISHLDVYLSGGNAPWLINAFLPLFNGLIKGQIERESNLIISVLINQELNELLKTIPSEILLPESYEKVGLDYSLVANPGFTDRTLMFPHLGEFFQWGLPRVGNTHFRMVLPGPRDESKMLNSLFSNYMLVTVCEAFYKSGTFVLEIRDSMLPDFSPIRLNTNEFRLLLPNLPRRFPNAELMIKLITTEYPKPEIYIEGGYVEFLGDIEWYAIVDGKYHHAFTFTGMIACRGKVFLKNMKAVGELSLVRFKNELKETNIGSFSVEAFDNLLNMLFSRGVIPRLNEILQSGIELPSIHGLSLRNEDIQYHNGYVDIGADFTINIAKRKEVDVDDKKLSELRNEKNHPSFSIK